MNQFVRDYKPLQKQTKIINPVADAKHLFKDTIFSVFHNNIRSVSKNFQELEVFLSSYDNCFDCICLTETWKIDNINYFSLNGYDSYYNNSQINQNDGVLLYIKNNISHKVDLIEFGPITFLTAYITLSSKSILITVVYKPPPIDEVIFIQNLTEYLNSHKKYYDYQIFLGDINIDILTNNNISNAYLDSLYTFGYISQINEYTRVQQNSASCIDHIFIKSLFDNVTPFILRTAITDHYSTAIGIASNIELSTTDRSYYMCSKINTKKLQNIMEQEQWNDFYGCTDTDIACNIFINKLKDNINRCTSEYKVTIKKRKSWITNGLVTSIQERDRMYYEMLNNPEDLELKNNYKNYRNKLNKIISKTKNEYYEKKILTTTDSKSIWKIVKQINNVPEKNKSINEIKTKNGNVASNNKDIASEFNNFFADIGHKLATNIIQPNIVYNEQINQNSIFLTDVTQIEIRQYLNSLKNNKSPGKDQIKNETLKEIGYIITPPLVYLINLIFKTGKCPSHFKTATIIPVYKSGDKLEIQNYRPISLISGVAKIFEKALKQRIVSFIDKYNLISSKQFGFRAKMSTNDAISELIGKIYQNIDKSVPSLCIFADLAKAFDTVSHSLLMRKLWQYGFRGTVYELIKNYLYERTQCVKINGTYSSTRTVLYGLPQGTVLAPVLFTLYLNNLLTLDLNCDMVSFADDTCFYFRAELGENWTHLKERVSIALKRIKDWFDQNLLTLNTNKTKFVPFTSYINNLPPYKVIQIENTNLTIEFSDNIKYLGIIIDSHLKWNLHVEYTIKKIRSLIYYFKQVRKVLNFNKTKQIYFALVESLLRYGLIAWGGASKTIIELLMRTQTQIIKIMLNKNIFYSTELTFKESEFYNLRQLYCETLAQYQFKQTNVNINHAHNTRQAKDRINVPVAKKTVGMKCFLYLAPRLYNHLPHCIKSIIYYVTYKKELKKWILDQSLDKINNFVNFGVL